MFVSEIIDEVIEILGRCDRQKALKRITEAVKSLQDEGDWNANIGVIDVRTFNDEDLVTLPRDVETPLAVTVNGMPAFMRDEFFRYHLNGDGLRDEQVIPWAWDDEGGASTFMDIKAPGPIIPQCELLSDEGKIVRILGSDPSGRKLRSQLEDGEWVDGIILPLEYSLTNPTAAPTSYIFKRLFEIVAMDSFTSLTPHNLVTGAFMQAAVGSGTFPAPLIVGSRYYVRIISNNKISLHRTRLDAETNQAAIKITNTGVSSTIILSDERDVSSRNQWQTVGNSLLTDYDLVTFLGTVVPPPLSLTKTYPIRVNGSDKFVIYDNVQDAEAETNPINVTAPGSGVKIRALKTVSPVTTLNFTIRHNLLTGDSVTVENSGGALPDPLLAGQTYYVRVLNNFSITLHETLNDTIAGDNPITLTSSGSGTNSVVKVIPCTVIPGSNSNVTTATNHNLSQPSGSGAQASANLQAQSVVSISISNAGSGYEASPIVQITGGGGTGASAAATVSGGIVTAIQVITGGTGYTSAPTVTLVPAGGSLVRFTTNGTMPAPITQGTIYRAEAPLSSNTFTLNSTVPQPITITSQGSGSLFLVISRVFSLGFLPQWRVNADNYVTGSEIRFFTDGTLPITSPQIDQTTIYYIRKINSKNVEIYDTLVNAQNLASTTGRISTISIGGGTLYLSSEKNVTAVVRDNYLDIEFTGYLANLTEVQFSTTGTLPQPLLPATTYKVSVVNDKIEVYTSGNSLITLTGIGSGEHKLNVSRTFSVDESTALQVNNQQYEIGDSVTVESESVLPTPLLPLTTYFLRPIGVNEVEVYPTLADAINVPSTTNRILFTSTGDGLHRILQIRPAIDVASVYQIEKPITEGYVKIFAWDTDRDLNLCLLGDLQPTETNPVYRRIRVARKTTWVRMKYRRRAIDIVSERDFINLDSKMAILMMVQSQELLFKKFSEEAERYRQISVEYLNKRNRALDGPRAPTLQINADVTTVPEDWMD